MEFYVFLSIVIVLFVVCYGSCITYVKQLRNKNEKRLKDYQVILICVLFGGPALLITYMFKEVRDEDYLNHFRYLISGIVLTILQILLVILLVYFKVLTL